MSQKTAKTIRKEFRKNNERLKEQFNASVGTLIKELTFRQRFKMAFNILFHKRLEI